MRQLKSRKISGGFAVRLVILGLLWCWLVYIILQVRQVLATSALYQNFDPYEILEVGIASSSSQIKKAFHKLSLKYHPDKNSDEGAGEKFMLIKKAYDALTDPVAKRNYRLYGNPDGPTRVELSVALPTVSKEMQGLVLVLFVILFIIGVPLLMLYAMGTPSLDSNGLPRETNKVLSKGFSSSLDAKQLQELILNAYAAAEAPKKEPLDDIRSELQAAGASLKVRKAENGEAESVLALQRAETLLWSHLLRRTDLLRERGAELDSALKKWQVACKFLLQEAASKGYADTASSCLDFHRGLVQAVDPSSASKGGTQLLQIPHFTGEQVKLWQKRHKRYATLPAFLEMPSEERAAALSAEEMGLDASQRADIEEFVAVAPRMVIQDARVVVEGEDEICVGDLATLEVKLQRLNLREDEAVGSAHAPHFPGQVSEAWWLTFRLPGRGRSSRSGSSVCRRFVDGSREVVSKVRFRVPLAGKSRLRLSLTCEAYAGFELEQEVSYLAKTVARPARGDDSGSGDDSGEETGSDY